MLTKTEIIVYYCDQNNKTRILTSNFKIHCKLSLTFGIEKSFFTVQIKYFKVTHVY